MSGQPLQVFTDFMQSTGPAIYTSAQQFVNEASKRNYLLGRFLVEDEMGDHVGGGDRLRDYILADASSTFQFYHPNSMMTWQNPQVMEKWEVHWRRGIDHMAWEEGEILNQVGSGLTKTARFQVYKNVRREKEARMWTSMMNGMEDHLFAAPSNAEMETAEGIQPYSLPTLINENTNGLPTGFTTLQQIDPTVRTFWKPRQVQYDYADPDDTDGDSDGLFDAFDDMEMLLQFKPPPKGSEFFERHYMQRLIVTNRSGKKLFKKLMRESGDRGYVTNPQDPSYSNPQFSGYDIVEVDTLQSAQLYSDGSGGLADWANANEPGPRYYWINTEYVRMVFHRDRYFYKNPVKDHPNQVGAFRLPVTTWYNLFCRSRQRGTGIVYPGA